MEKKHIAGYNDGPSSILALGIKMCWILQVKPYIPVSVADSPRHRRANNAEEFGYGT
jgi:hypothetical protein